MTDDKPEGTGGEQKKVCHIWGLGTWKKDNLRVVHKFKNGKSRCKDEHGRRCGMKYARPSWIPRPDDGVTCPECYAQHLLDCMEENARKGVLDVPRESKENVTAEV